MPEAIPPTAAVDNINADSVWNNFRNSNFLRPGPNMGWVWSSADDFDFVAVGIHLRARPGIRVDVGSWAMAIIDNSDALIVPLVRLTEGSVEALQPSVSFDIKARQAEIRLEQSATADAIHRAAQHEVAARIHPAPPHTH